MTELTCLEHLTEPIHVGTRPDPEPMTAISRTKSVDKRGDLGAELEVS